jgi:hypothetical protein
MLTPEFYSIIDAELDAIIAKNPDDDVIKKHRTTPNNQKSYAFLIWFLEVYGKIPNYIPYITENEKDSSCDIVFDKKNADGSTVFYIVQAKWKSRANCEAQASKTEILATLNDFEVLLSGRKRNVSEKLQEKLDELYKHLRNNGDVKFIFLTLCHHNPGTDENIAGFKRGQVRTDFEVIDINRLKADYIDRTFKNIDPENPLERYSNPEEHKISLEIERLEGQFNHIAITKPFDAFVFLVRPKMLWELFRKFGFLLFQKNVRNPLLQSQFNTDIERTAIEDPLYFWYYNNGITAITPDLPVVRSQATKLTVTGLQVINGAQTVYSIYHAYENASPSKRKEMNRDMLITLRLLKSAGREFDLKVTRYTNAQNPIEDRDFHANDDIQIALQNASYSTNVWYEKRRGEFREKPPEGVRIVSSEVFASIYLSCYLQDPVSVLMSKQAQQNSDKNILFLSRRDHPQGLYEKIFNRDTSFEKMLAGYYIFDAITKNNPNFPQETLLAVGASGLALTTITISKYLHAKFSTALNITGYIVKQYAENNTKFIIQCDRFTGQFIGNNIETEDENKTAENIVKFMSNVGHFERLKLQLEETDITVEDIENIEIPPTLEGKAS